MDADLALIEAILADNRSGKLTLPTLPEVAFKVQRLMADAGKGPAEIARVVQVDPALTAWLIRVANSPVYRGQAKVTSCRAAITRMGIRTARHLVTSHAVRSAFWSNNQSLQQQMERHWEQSRRVAAICAVLARNIPGLEPDRALMAGLVRDIGVLPVLQQVERYPEIVSSPSRIEHIIGKLRGPLGTLVLRSWKFDEEMATIPSESEQWLRDPAPQPDYADLVMIGYIHSLFGSAVTYSGPPLVQLPAFRKLSLGEEPATSFQLIEDAREEIAELVKMLQG